MQRSSLLLRLCTLVVLAATGTAAARSLAATPPPDFGPNVFVFGPDTAPDAIQSRLDTLFAEQERAQFGTGRYAVLFKPGRYAVNARVGFYTQVLGLGRSPDDVDIRGGVTVDARWRRGTALVNFWRCVENLSITPADGVARYAVSQAAPLRRVHVKGDLVLDDGGWSSGGFIADSKIDGEIRSGTQQQWLTRNSTIGRWLGSNWNMVFVGVAGAPPPSFPKPPFTVVARAPVGREKPFLVVDGEGRYGVFVPALNRDTAGPTWDGGQSAGTTIPIEDFYIGHASADNAETLNAALASGRHLLLTPGIYRLKDPLRITRPDTVVLGLGLATLLTDNGAVAMRVADVDGVKIAGILFDAGPTASPVQLEVGPSGSNADHSANPTSLHDLFFRVGGGGLGKVDVSLVVNSNHVIGDDFWLWRADHGQGVGWAVNTTANGIIVNGNDVTIYGLAVEHYHREQALWNGNGGRVYFYQNELPYEVPDQATWRHDGRNGYAAYKVADRVTTHEAWGLGIYCNFATNPEVKLESAIEAPHLPGVRFHHVTTVSLGGGKGEITHVVNDVGEAAVKGHAVVTLKEFPPTP